jgi:hypothetical protein
MPHPCSAWVGKTTLNPAPVMLRSAATKHLQLLLKAASPPRWLALWNLGDHDQIRQEQPANRPDLISLSSSHQTLYATAMRKTLIVLCGVVLCVTLSACHRISGQQSASASIVGT